MATDKTRVQGRKIRSALCHATPVEKAVLDALIQKGKWRVPLDVGIPIAMHLQEIGLIEQTRGLPYTTYNMVSGLSEMCIKKPALLHLPIASLADAKTQVARWQTERIHQGFFIEIAEPTSTSWMAY